ncbi:MAG TPA: hypothetical protein VHB23_13110 [Devosiaceae bacterium]|jgi:hypothetical protein|nr:hypothetical protein [Devosiaceae bacterium]
MQLSAAWAACFALCLSVGAALGQSLAPTHAEGATPSNVKGFYVTVGNPYRTAMTFRLLPLDPSFSRGVADAVAQPATLTLAPGFSRRAILAFKIPPGSKERTIGLCVMPQKIAGPVLPRVCGRYTGVLAGSGG